MNRISLCLFKAIKFLYFVLCLLGWGRVWTWVYDPPMTFTILSGRWVGDTGCPAKSSTKGLGVPQTRRRKVVTLLKLQAVMIGNDLVWLQSVVGLCTTVLNLRISWFVSYHQCQHTTVTDGSCLRTTYVTAVCIVKWKNDYLVRSVSVIHSASESVNYFLSHSLVVQSVNEWVCY
jgi:hypothetical protein